MKKSMFKRGIASATGILLAASQVGMLAMNTTAAEVTVDAAYLTDVPVFVDPEGALQYTEGSWYDLLFSAYTAADALDQEIALDAAKDSAKGLFSKYLGTEATEVLMASISNAKLTGNAGKYTITATLDDCGEVVGAAILNKLTGVDVDTVPMALAGTLTVGIDMTTENTIAVATSFAAEDGNIYTAANIEEYIIAKLTEGLIAVDKMDAMPGLVEKLGAAKAAIADINFTTDSFEDAYAQYVAGLPKKLADKAPATLAEAMANEKANSALAQVIDTINGAQDVATIGLTVADIADIMAQSYDIAITVTEGTSALAEFSIPDDQNAELLAAFAEYYTTAESLAELEAYFAEAYELDDEKYTYTVTGVESHKELTVAASGTGVTYEIIRVIDSVTLELEDTTTTTETTTTTTETTTTETTTSETTTTPVDVVYSYEYKVEGDIADGRFYWSEETVAFDLSAISGSLIVLDDGEAIDTVTIGSEYYVADAASAAELAFEGYGAYTVAVKLSDSAVTDLAAILEEKGYDVTALSDVLDTTAVADEFTVVVVNRGDATLDNKDNNTADAVRILTMYNRISLQKLTAEEVQTSFDMSDTDFNAMCFAADVDADQDIDIKDAMASLKFYNFNYLLQTPKTWDEILGVESTTHADAQHVDPLVVFGVE